VRPKCQADLLKQEFQEEKYSVKIKAENEIAGHSAAERTKTKTGSTTNNWKDELPTLEAKVSIFP
jgi:hypothetical protein